MWRAKSAFRPEPDGLETKLKDGDDSLGINKKEEQEMAAWQNMKDNPAPVKDSKEGNVNALKHGIFANRILNEEEKELFDTMVEKLHEDFQFNKSSDFLQVELVGVYSVKLMRAQMEGNTDAAERLDRMIRAHMRELKTTKISREGEQPQQSQTSPAEWAAALLDRVAEITEKTKESKPASTKKRKKSADNIETAEDEPSQ